VTDAWVEDRVLELPADTVSPGAARRFLRDVFEESSVVDPPSETAVLLASELVSNAVLHARTDLAVRCLVHETCVRIEVSDGNSRRPVAAFTPVDATSGRGLGLVQALSDNWGIEGTADGKLVWFEVPIDAP
jgi:anti-sigma regulatory factor (Ser/Thr protein kinase)